MDTNDRCVGLIKCAVRGAEGVSLISHTSYPLAYEDGTDTVLQNVGY
jgi:hypothetical protein